MDESEKRIVEWLRAAYLTMHVDFERRYAPERREHREKHNEL